MTPDVVTIPEENDHFGLGLGDHFVVGEILSSAISHCESDVVVVVGVAGVRRLPQVEQLLLGRDRVSAHLRHVHHDQQVNGRDEEDEANPRAQSLAADVHLDDHFNL